jgi:hypothetical protein
MYNSNKFEFLLKETCDLFDKQLSIKTKFDYLHNSIKETLKNIKFNFKKVDKIFNSIMHDKKLVKKVFYVFFINSYN